MPEPTIDPMTGKPKIEPPPTAPPPNYVPQSDFDALRQRLDVFEQVGLQQQQRDVYSPPAGPSFDDQIADFDKKLEALDTQIDKAVEDGNAVSRLLRERDKINSARVRLEVNREFDPKFAAGVETIDFLAGEVTRRKMPHYDIVKDDVERHLKSLPANQRMNPQVRQAAYQLAVGQNVDKIVAAKEEEVRRSVAENASMAPNGPNGRMSGGQGYSEGVPDPKKILGSGAIAALKAKNVSVDQEYQRRGYVGWEDYWNKTGKKYFDGEEA